MALAYTYKDTYIVNSISVSDLEAAETDALTDLGNQGVTDVYYLEKMCLCLVYITLGTQQLEAEGMIDRVRQYREEYKRYSTMDNFEGVDDGVFCGEVGRA